MATWINVHIESFADMDARRKLHLTLAELDFWRREAQRLQDTIDNVYSRAEAGELTELWRNGSKILVAPVKEAKS
jgi:hypothetical protein